MGKIKFISYGIFLGIVLFWAMPAFGATEFVSIVDPDNAVGTDYTSLSAWEAGVQTDLTATTTKVFSHGGITGAIADIDTVTGVTSGATASVVHATTTQILLETISGTFQSGEQVQVNASNLVTISDAGDSAIAVAECRSTGGTADTTAVTIDGWTTSATNYVKVTVHPDHRHQGVWDDTKYTFKAGGNTSSFTIKQPYSVVEYLQVECYNGSTYNINGINVQYISNYIDGGGYSTIRNNITRNSGPTKYLGFRNYVNEGVKVYNNIFYNHHIGLYSFGTYTSTFAYNNTVYNNSTAGIYNSTGSMTAKNNIAFNNTDDFGLGSGTLTIDSCASDDGDGTNAVILDSTNDYKNEFTDPPNSNFRLVSGSSAIDSGVDLSTEFTTDIDGTARGGAFDIGADEVPVDFVSTICENTSAGGNCANLDYSTLATWEDKVESDLTADTTRVFSGSLTGTLAENATVNLCNGATDTNIDGVVVAHTASGQILIDGITGSTNPLITTSGYVWNDDACGGTTNLWTVSGTGDDLGASARAVAMIDGVWSSVDSNPLVVDGWTTDYDNKIRIYTTKLARHSGVKGTGYQMVMPANSSAIGNYEENIEVDGLSIGGTNWDSNSSKNAFANFATGFNNVIISNNLMYDIDNPGVSDANGYYSTTAATGYVRIYNNIIYSDERTGGNYGIRPWTSVNGKKYYIYNNTIIDMYYGIAGSPSGSSRFADIKNNIVQGGNINYMVASNFDVSENNISSDNSTPDAGFGSTTVQFADEANDDFHLLESDSGAKDKGVDLSADTNLAFSTDIDGQTRDVDGAGWDIGADETAVKIYRSVGPAKTTTLATDTSHANTVTLTSGVATFSTALADNIGVGDVVLIDTAGTDQTIDSADTILFIHSRTDSTHYTLRTESGAIPSDIAINDTYSIYRAYTSLSLAEAGTKNTSIPITFTGGNRDLVTNNEQWNLACYGDAVDTTAVTVDGWTTGENNYLKIYTPVETSEVGVSQRHEGKWDEGKYRFVYTGNNAIYVQEDYAQIDGLQIDYTYNSTTQYSAIRANLTDKTLGNVQISNNIIKIDSTSTGQAVGILIYGGGWGDIQRFKIWNNIIIGTEENTRGIHSGYTHNAYAYNNTVYNVRYGFSSYSSGIRFKLINNIAQGCVDGFNTGAENFNPDSDYNISDIAGDAPNATFTGGEATVSFADETNDDFHLSPTDTTAIDAGTDLSADANLAFSTDIDGHLRTSWDIGADEASIEFDPTVMQSGGDYSTLASWEAGVQTDLTVDTTRVFSHGGITGAIADTDTVTGITSGATANVVHATTTQILLETISGTFQSGEQVQVDASNHITLSNAGNPAIAVAKIDGAWTTADTSEVTIDGWTTGPNNYVKVYTTDIARHSGVYDTSKYILSNSNYFGSLNIQEEYAMIDGLQIVNSRTTDGVGAGIRLGRTLDVINGGKTISNNIILKQNGIINNTYNAGITFSGYSLKGENKIFNNIVYDFNSGMVVSGSDNSEVFVFNNTVHSAGSGGILGNFYGENDSLYMYNNIVDGSGGNDYEIVSTLTNSGYGNNISSDATAPGTNSKTNATVQFVDEANNDFHLAETDTTARDAGADLSTTFTTDIDGDVRLAGVWDIGADEAPTKIYRSIGPSKTSAVDDDNSQTETLTIANLTATFNTAGVADNVGVGDVILYDSNGDNALTSADSIVFIHGRTDSQNFTVANADGSAPDTETTANDKWAIYRAHTSLANAEAGTKNTSIPITFTGGNRDLVTNNEQWNLACYGDAVDTTSVTVNGWTTGENNYLKIYTPVATNEVGVSQRHEGKWDDSKYNLQISNGKIINILENNVRMDGLQLYQTTGNGHVMTGVSWNGTSWDEYDFDLYISNNIIRNSYGSGGISDFFGSPGATLNIFNNIIYDGSMTHNSGSVGIGVSDVDITINAYNNTIDSFYYGIFINAGTAGEIVAKNNIVQNCTDGYSGSFDASSDYNISDIAGDAPNATWTAGASALIVQFEDEANDDFHLDKNDTAARMAGVNLSSDPYLSFSDDIDGQERLVVWDIGADGTFLPKIEMRGDLQFRGNIKMR